MSTGEWRKRYYTRIGRKLRSYRNELVHSRHGGKSSESVRCVITGPCLRMRHRPSA